MDETEKETAEGICEQQSEQERALAAVKALKAEARELRSRESDLRTEYLEVQGVREEAERVAKEAEADYERQWPTPVKMPPRPDLVKLMEGAGEPGSVEFTRRAGILRAMSAGAAGAVPQVERERAEIEATERRRSQQGEKQEARRGKVTYTEGGKVVREEYRPGPWQR